MISSQIPAARTRLLLGLDNVDRWSEQRIWDAALKDVQIVVSTHAILADALTYGFVRMTKLALLVFDEGRLTKRIYTCLVLSSSLTWKAHHCARGDPANRIMRDFYHRTKRELGSVPHILGLTASPIMRSKPTELQLVSMPLR